MELVRRDFLRKESSLLMIPLLQDTRIKIKRLGVQLWACSTQMISLSQRSLLWLEEIAWSRLTTICSWPRQQRVNWLRFTFLPCYMDSWILSKPDSLMKLSFQNLSQLWTRQNKLYFCISKVMDLRHPWVTPISPMVQESSTHSLLPMLFAVLST